jgi:hypothetical protein
MPAYFLRIKEGDEAIEVLDDMGLLSCDHTGSLRYHWIPSIANDAKNTAQIKKQLDFLDGLAGVQDYFVDDKFGLLRKEFPILTVYGDKNSLNELKQSETKKK